MGVDAGVDQRQGVIVSVGSHRRQLPPLVNGVHVELHKRITGVRAPGDVHSLLPLEGTYLASKALVSIVCACQTGP